MAGGIQFVEDVVHEIVVTIAQVAVEHLIHRAARVVETDEHVAHGHTQAVSLLFGHVFNFVVEEVEKGREVELLIRLFVWSRFESLEQMVDVAGFNDGLGICGNEGEEVDLLVLLLQVQLGIHECSDYGAA